MQTKNLYGVNSKSSSISAVRMPVMTCVTNPVGHFGKYHNILCLSPQILHKHCFQFLLGHTMRGQTKSIMVFSEVAYKLQMNPVNQLFHAQNQR